MPFDPQEFAAKVVLGELHSEDLPAAAQDALEAGFDGSAIVRLAILDNPSTWEIEPLMGKVLAELSVTPPDKVEAAIFLAKRRAQRILDNNEDPISSLDYFERLHFNSGYPEDLAELGWLQEDWWGADDNGQKHAAALEAIENLFNPALRDQRIQERKTRWEDERRKAPEEWPYKLNSKSGRREFWRRFPLRWIELHQQAPWYLPAWIGLVLAMSWLCGSWWIALFCFLVLPPIMLVINMLVLWRLMSYEVQARRWRERIDL